jgi:hypothetical protein
MAAALATIAVGLSTSSIPQRDVSAAAAITLTEVAGTPFVAKFGGWDLGFGSNSMWSSPAVADVTGDGQPEVIVGGMNSIARVYNLASGRIHELNPGGANLQTGHGATHPSPAIADLNGDGVSDVVIANTGGRLAAYSVRNDVVAPMYNRYVEPAFVGAIEGMIATPAIGYIDDDTVLDVVTSSWGQTLETWSGPPGEPVPALRQWLKDTLWSSPVIGDISGNGTQSIVVGGDCEGLGTPQPCYGLGQGGYVWAFNLDGSLKWSYFVRDAVVWSTPALIDLNNDGALDVVVGTGLFFLGPAANKIFALDGKTGRLLWNAPTPGPVLGSPSVARVNGQARVWVMSGGGYLMSFDQAGRRVYQSCSSDQPCDPALGTFGGIAIADINNDGSLEAVTQTEQRLKVFDAVSGQLITSVRSRYGRDMFAPFSTPTVASVGGKTWILTTSIGDANGNLRVDGDDDLVVSAWTTGTALGLAPWPTFKGNMARTGGPPIDPAVARGRRPYRGSLTPFAARPDASAFISIAATQNEGRSFIQALPCDAPAGGTSNLNLDRPGQSRSAAAVVRLAGDGRACLYNQATTHMIVDLQGYIANAATDDVPDQRILDTRSGAKPAAGSQTLIRGRANSSAIVSLAVTETSGRLFVQILPCGTPAGATSNLNADSPGQARAGLAVIRFDASGNACVFVQNSTHVVVDLQAYLTSTALDDVPDTRLVDTRDSARPDAGSITRLRGRPNASAFVSITAVDTAGRLFVQVLPCGSSPGATSNLNADSVGQTVSGAAVIRFDEQGEACVYVQASTHIVVDLQGYFSATAFDDVPDQRLVDTRRA